MAGRTLARVFRTSSGRRYVYDPLTNRIITIRQSVEGEDEESADRLILRELLDCSFISAEPFPRVVWRDSFESALERMTSQVPRLILQITRRCNLRCDYCVYSGHYAHMQPHADEDMSEETISRSLDLFALRSEGCDSVSIDLYGGETLLCLERMRFAVRHARSVLPGKTIAFHITSNGVLLNDGVGQWLAENPDIQLTLTVNGPYHDQHRVTPAGRGSLGIILENVRRIRVRHPKVWQNQLQFIANIVHSGQLVPLKAFYEQEIGKAPVLITHIQSEHGNEAIQDILSADAEEAGTEEKLCKQFCQRDDPFLEAYFGAAIRAVRTRPLFDSDAPGYVGSCFPLVDRIFVQCNGDMGICESACDRVVIGHIDRGIDREKLRALYDGAEALFAGKCRLCWAQRLCTVCLKDTFAADGTFLPRISEEFCEASKAYALNQLRMLCEIAEREPERLKRFD